MLGNRSRPIFIVSSLLCGVVALFVAMTFQMTTDMGVFFPEGEQRTKATVSRALSTGELSRTLVVTLEAPNATEAAARAALLENIIRADAALVERLTHASSGPPPGMDEALWALYSPRALAFLAGTAEEASLRLQDSRLDETLSQLTQSLASPISPMVSRVAPEDPFLIVPNLLQSLLQAGPTLAVEDGHYVARERYGVVFLATKAAAMDGAEQAEIWASLERAFTELRRVHPDVHIETSGFARFAQSTQAHMEADISRIATISILGLALFCWLLFRSLRLLVLLQVPIALGMLAALAATLLVWGNVHGVTLAVGASLIGVAMDYVLHYYAHWRLCPSPEGPLGTMRDIKVALLLGALTTVVGFAVLGASPFPALVQIATFSAVGVAVALLATLFIVPHLVRRNEEPTRLLAFVADTSARCVRALLGRRAVARGLVVAATLVSVVGITRAEWQDDLSTLTVPDEHIAAEDARVRKRITSLDTRRMVVALGEDDEQALAVNAAVAASLERASAAGEVEGWQGVAKMLPTRETQRAVHRAVLQADLSRRLPLALERAGFDAAAFAPFFERLQRPDFVPLTFGDIAGSPAAELVRSHRLTLDAGGHEQVAYLTFLRGVQDGPALERRLQTVSGALYIDQNQLMVQATRQHRLRTSELLLAGLVGVFLVLLVQYRSWRHALSATIPAVLAATVTLAVLGLVGVPLNILGLTSLLMVLSLGVDYSVFLVGEGDVDLASNSGLGATMAGLLVSWVSNVCGFGLLAMSQQPALRLIGLIAGIGVTCALILAPTALVLGVDGASPLARSKGARLGSAGHAPLR